MCKATSNGVYAMKVDVDVWYMDEVNASMGGVELFDPGRGKLTIYFRNTLSSVCDDGTGGMAIAHPCGTRIPALYAGTVGGVIQITFPDDLWDKPMIPDYMTTGHTTGFDPGSTLTIDKTTGLLGIDLASVDAAWPSYDQTPNFMCSGGKTGAMCFPDADGDGKPGITVKIQLTGMPASPGYDSANGDPWAYVPAPTGIPEALSKAGADTVYIGLRTKVGGSGAIGSDCKSGMGSAEAEDFESRVVDCVGSDGTPCTPTGASFVDQNTPAFHVLKMGDTPPAMWMMSANAAIDKSASMGPQSSVVRLGDVGETFTCEQVRAAFPQ
jgi:hypothetical protein